MQDGGGQELRGRKEEQQHANPSFPFPSYHIDTYLTSLKSDPGDRIIWMLFRNNKIVCQIFPNTGPENTDFLLRLSHTTSRFWFLSGSKDRLSCLYTGLVAAHKADTSHKCKISKDCDHDRHTFTRRWYMLYFIEFLLVPGEGAFVLWSIVIRCDEVVTD